MASHVAERRTSIGRRLEDDREAWLDLLPALVWIADAQGSVTHYNRRWHEYTGATPQQMQGWGWESVHDPELLPLVVERWRAAIAIEEPFHMAFPLRGRDGTFRWFLAHATPFRDSSGRVVRWIGLYVDIDEQKRAEGDLTTTLRMREELLAMVSHDLRNPLNGVLLAATHIERLADDSAPWMRAKKAARSIARGVDQMLRLVGDLLDLAKLEAGKALFLDLQWHDSSGLIREATEQLEPLASARRLTLRTELPARPVLVFCDRGRISQVLANLVGNAIKFTPEGGTICIQAAREKAELVVSVRDTGVGIREDQVHLVFQQYWQADAQRNRGTGLGLSIAKAIVEAHGGGIGVKTVAGIGSTFSFALAAAGEPNRSEEDQK